MNQLLREEEPLAVAFDLARSLLFLFLLFYISWGLTGKYVAIKERDMVYYLLGFPRSVTLFSRF